MRWLREAATRFGLDPFAEPEPVNEAWSNEVYRLRTRTGDHAVKLFAAGLDSERLGRLRRGMAFEAAVLGSGAVPMARPVPVEGAGSWLAEVDTPAGRRLARCHAWVAGTPATVVAPTAQLVRDVGRSLGVLHALGRPGGDTSGLPPPDLDRWNRAVQGALDAGLDWSTELAELTPLVEELAEQVAELRGQRRPMLVSHRDLDPKNAVVQADGRVALTDWDYAGPVLPDVELVTAATSFAGPDVREDLVGEFVRAYRAAGGTARPTDSLATVAESADTDWLLRNVEARVRADSDEDLETRDRFSRELIASFAADVADLRTWSDRIGQI